MAAQVVVIMGVAGSGKSTVGARLAEALGCGYFDADAFHAPESIAKMKSGVPLAETDRLPWLARIAAKIEALLAAGQSGVIGCSALKRRYRDILFSPVDRERVALVYLKGSYDLIHRRLEARRDHFMPPSLLRSQFDQLEAPGADEQPIVVDIAPAPEAIAATVQRELARRAGDRHSAVGAA
jgi:gluconokinase